MLAPAATAKSKRTPTATITDPKILIPAIGESFKKLNPVTLVKNPVMFVVEVVALLVTVLFVRDVISGAGNYIFSIQIILWLWFTVLFANFAEAVAEGRGKAQAASLRATKTDIVAKKLANAKNHQRYEPVPAMQLKPGDVVFVEAGDLIPSDGEVIQGVASVNEAAITGESAPVIRESGGDRSAVTGGTLVISDWIVVRITAGQGSTFLDRMIALVEGAERKKTPNGIAGMDRLVRFNVLAMSGRAVEAAGDVDTLLLDKTGTITLGNRQASEFIPLPDVTEKELADAAQLASLSDETPEGRSIVVLAKDRYGIRGRDLAHLSGHHFIPFSAQTRISGIDLEGEQIRKGAVDAVVNYVRQATGNPNMPAPPELERAAEAIATSGGTPLAVARNGRLLGLVHLKDIIKGGIRERFAELRRMGIRTIMITGDNPLTAAAIAAEAGVDDFLAQATPENKLNLIREEQAKGKLVAMCGDGTNDAPAQAQADVGVAMNTGTMAAREAGNMIDLDSDPTKLIEIVEIGKQLLITRGALTTFSIANDVAKYFAIIPAMFVAFYPQLNALNVMHLSTPQSAILSAIIFNALIIIFLIPLALRGVRYRPLGASKILTRNLLIYGVGGIIVPFIGIKLIDMAVSAAGLA